MALVSQSKDYFSIFDLPRRFQIDREALEKKYYEMSRTLHPDRFAGGGNAELQAQSLTEMSFLNQAYQTLKSPETLREYVLELEGVKIETKGQVPLELAEEWFELQDEPSTEKLTTFETQLRDLGKTLQSELSEIERAYDTNPSHTLLEKLAAGGQKFSYLKSMSRDVQKLRAKQGI